MKDLYKIQLRKADSEGKEEPRKGRQRPTRDARICVEVYPIHLRQNTMVLKGTHL